MKKLFTCLLLILFLFNTLGYYFIFECYKRHVRKEIQARANKNTVPLTILRIADIGFDREFQRIEKKEIRYKGSLYDVIREVQSGRTTIFYCIHDKKEEALLAAMNAVNKNKFLLSLWQHLIKIAIPPIEVDCANPIAIQVIFPQITVKLPSVIESKLNPPPESV